MNMKKVLCALLSAAMLATTMLSTVPAYAQDTGTRISATFLNSSRYELGVAADNVRLSWQLSSADRGIQQQAYRVVVRDEQSDVWDSGWVESAEQTGITPENLRPDTVYHWKVNVRDQDGRETGFSEERMFETAPAQLEGMWITSPRLLRKTFTLDQDLANIARARSYFSSPSILETRMNGSKVGDLVFGPKKPVPDVETYYNTFDLMPYLQDGENTIGLMVSGIYPQGNRAIGMVKITYKDGSTQVISTDTTWRACANSEITRESISAGEDVDANLITNWDTPSFIEDETWSEAAPAGMQASDGQLHVPAYAGTYYTRESFSGDYSVEVTATVLSNVCGFLFGSGSPNPPMWQIGPGGVRVHYPGNWDKIEIAPSDIQLNKPVTMRLDIVGNTVTASIDGVKVHETTLADGQTSGPLGFRSMPDEIVDYDRIAVYQNGEVIWEDNFDTADSTKWTFPEDPAVSPAISGVKVIDEVKPVSMHEVDYSDLNSPYTANGHLIMPTNCGTFTTKQSFSGNYTVELAAKTDNVFGFLFGSGTPYPAMWQLATSGNGSVRLHNPGDWSTGIRVLNDVPGVDLSDFVEMKIEVSDNHVTTYVAGQKVDECDLPDGATSGPLGIRETIAENCVVDYIRVTQGGEVVWEDNFDRIDSSKWNGFVEPSTKYVLDFGKNMQGYVRVNTTGAKDSQIQIKYSELLNDDGTIFANTTFHYPKCTYTLSGGNDTFEPRFFYTGFRYVEVSSTSGEINPDDFTACFLSDDLDQTGFFESSNDRLNKVFDMYYRAQRSNMIGNYTDCPQREKNGWTGDASVTKESTALILNDYTSAEAYMKTMYQVITEEGKPGIIIPWVSTENNPAEFDIPWASAYFVFPYETYMQTGDRYYIDIAYDALVKVFDYYKSLDTDGDAIFTNNVYGDWLGYDNQEGKIDRGFLTAPYFYYCGALLAEMAEITGRDHAELDSYLNKMYDALQRVYNKESYFSTNTQTANGMALDFGIVPPSQKETIVQTLVNAVAAADTTIKTGVLGTKSMYDALSQANEHKTLLDMTITPKKCSFGYMIDNGATTLWEYWDKAGETFNSNLTPGNAVWDSQNHCMMGGGPAVWMFNGLGGITATSGGYRTINYRAGVESELTYVNSSIDTIIGTAVSNWTNADGKFTWEITVPANATATITIPIQNATAITEGGKDILGKDGDGLTYVGLDEDGCSVYTAGSGSYQFTATDKEIPTPSDTDKSILNRVIKDAEELQKTDEYLNAIPMVQESFDAALAAAKEVADNPQASQEQINSAWITLMNEIHKLGFQKGDKSGLQAAYDEAIALDQDEYEDGEAKDNFNLAIENAKAVLDDENAVQDEIDRAKAELELAQSQLVLAEVDKTQLKKVIDQADTYLEEDFQPEGWPEFEAALKAAKETYDNEKATKKEVEQATNDLLGAMFKLQYRQDKTELNKVIEYAQGLDLNEYTESSAAGLSEALNKALEVQADKGVYQPQIREATAELVEALLNLRYKADKSLLEKAVAEAEAIDVSGYSAEAVESYNAAKAKAEELLNNNDLSREDQEKIDEATAELNAAIRALKAEVKGDANVQTQKAAPKTGEVGGIAAVAGLMLLAGAAAALGWKKRR